MQTKTEEITWLAERVDNRRRRDYRLVLTARVPLLTPEPTADYCDTGMPHTETSLRAGLPSGWDGLVKSADAHSQFVPADGHGIQYRSGRQEIPAVRFIFMLRASKPSLILGEDAARRSLASRIRGASGQSSESAENTLADVDECLREAVMLWIAQRMSARALSQRVGIAREVARHFGVEAGKKAVEVTRFRQRFAGLVAELEAEQAVQLAALLDDPTEGVDAAEYEDGPLPGHLDEGVKRVVRAKAHLSLPPARPMRGLSARAFDAHITADDFTEETNG
jgi:hypothetical protein